MTKYNDDLPGLEYRMPDYDIRGVRIQRQVVAEKLGVAPEEVNIDKAMLGFTKAERWALVSEMTNRFFREVENEIAVEHPEYDEDKRLIEFVTRTYGPTLGGRFGEGLKQKRTKETNEHFN
jgi:uncharacterized protein YdhG (YjbR/CyaY superfamily)